MILTVRMKAIPSLHQCTRIYVWIVFRNRVTMYDIQFNCCWNMKEFISIITFGNYSDWRGEGERVRERERKRTKLNVEIVIVDFSLSIFSFYKTFFLNFKYVMGNNPQECKVLDFCASKTRILIQQKRGGEETTSSQTSSKNAF